MMDSKSFTMKMELPRNKIRLWAIVLFGLSMVFCGSVFAASAKTSLAIQPKESKIARLFIAMLDRDIEIARQALEPSGLLPAEWPRDASGVEIDPLPLQWPKSNLLRTLELARALAYVDPISQSKWKKNPENLSIILKAVVGVVSECSFDAPRLRFTKPPEAMDCVPLLEPMLTIYGLLEKQRSEPAWKNAQNWIERTLDSVWRHPVREQNDRGMVWCALMALATRVTGNDKYLNSADENLPWLLPLLAENGEYLDPNGFDLTRSNQFLRSLFLFRYYSGRDSLDAKIVSGLLWSIRLYTMRGVPLLGISEQPVQRYRMLAAQLLGPISFYAQREKTLAQTVARYMETMMDAPPGYALEGGGWSFLLAAEHYAIPETLTPLPYTPYVQVYEQSPFSRYVLVGRNYQTAVCLNDPAAVKGLQVWSYQGEPPLIFPSPPRYSRMVGYGYDSRQINSLQESREIPYQIASVTDAVDVLFVPGQPCSAYVFTNDMTVAIYKQPYEDAILEWIQDRRVCAQPKQFAGTNLQFDGSAASFLLPIDTVPNFEEFDGGNRYRLHFHGEYCWYTLAGPGSQSVVKPIHSGLMFVHIEEAKRMLNLVINLSEKSFLAHERFPGTEIPIPRMEPWSVRIIPTR